MIHRMERYFKPKRMIPFGTEGIVFYMDFNSGYKIIDKYSPYAVIINLTSNDFKKDPNGFGNMLEFDGIVERLILRSSTNPQMSIPAAEKFTYFCRFRILTIVSNGVIVKIGIGSAFLHLDIDLTSIKLIMFDDSESNFAFDAISVDTNWHEAKWGFDGNNLFTEFDGVRTLSTSTTHTGFTITTDISIAASITGSETLNVQISELGLIRGASI